MDSRETNSKYSKKKFFKSISISDIHFGKTNPEEEFNILNEQFINVIKDLDFNVLCIAGDLFHKKELTNSDTTKYANLFVLKCEEICIRNNATLILLNGTFEHDANQLKLFHPLKLQSKCDIRIIDDISIEYIDGFRVLCIPEKYGMGEDYYLEYLNNASYDLCFAHSTYVGSIYGKNTPDLNSRREPIFHMDHFRHCKGPILSGHVHTAKCYDSHFYYHGSPIRSQFGEEENKGFYCCIINRNTRKYLVHFEEIKSKTYNSYNIDKYLDDLEKCIEYIKSLEGDFIRVECNSNNPNANIIKDFCKDNNIKFNNHYNVTKNSITNNEVSKSIYDENSYIFDKSLNEYDILAMYINKNENSNVITAEAIKKTLSKMF